MAGIELNDKVFIDCGSPQDVRAIIREIMQLHGHALTSRMQLTRSELEAQSFDQ